jgi:hypothetical protein
MTATLERTTQETRTYKQLEALIPNVSPKFYFTWKSTIRLAHLLGEVELFEQCARSLEQGRAKEDYTDIQAKLENMVDDFIDRSEATERGHAQERHVGGPELIINRYREYKTNCGQNRLIQPKRLSCFASREDIVTVVKSMVLDDYQFGKLQKQLEEGMNVVLSRNGDGGPVKCEIPPLTGYSFTFDKNTNLDGDLVVPERKFTRAAVILRKDGIGQIYLHTCYPQP